MSINSINISIPIDRFISLYVKNHSWRATEQALESANIPKHEIDKAALAFLKARSDRAIEEHQAQEKDLTTAERDRMRSTTFGDPDNEAYPIPDKEHASLAIGRSKRKKIAKKIKRKACSKFPSLPACKK